VALQHVVLFNFPGGLGDADWADMRRQVSSWPEQIGGIDALRLGPPMYDERTRGHQYLLYLEVADEAALTTYQQHPVHQAFVRWLKERDCATLAFDYLLDDDTVVV
jgi:Stress responsive A/B Barrel Domain